MIEVLKKQVLIFKVALKIGQTEDKDLIMDNNS